MCLYVNAKNWIKGRPVHFMQSLQYMPKSEVVNHCRLCRNCTDRPLTQSFFGNASYKFKKCFWYKWLKKYFKCLLSMVLYFSEDDKLCSVLTTFVFTSVTRLTCNTSFSIVYACFAFCNNENQINHLMNMALL